MDQSGAGPQNNLPAALQQQLMIAAQHVRPSHTSSEQRQPHLQRPEQRGSTYHGPPPRRPYPYQGGQRPPQAVQPFHQPPRGQQSFQNRQGQGAGGSYRNRSLFTHQQQVENLGSRPSSFLSQGPPSTAQQTASQHTANSQPTTTVPSDSSSTPELSSRSSQYHVAAESCPTLGSSQLTGESLAQPAIFQSHPTFQPRDSVKPRYPPQMSVETAQAFYERASTGAYRGYGHNPYASHRHVQQVSGSRFMTDQNLPARGVVPQPRTYNPASDRLLGDPNSHLQHDIHQQCQYLSFLVQRENNRELNVKELQEKEAFRKELEKIVQNLIAEHAKDHVSVNPKSVRLKCYGSLASGFAIPGSDMDLLLMFPKDQGPIGPIEVDSRRMIEKALLDLGYGARLLTKTRVPILRVCQSPSPTLLENLRREREKWEEETKEEEKEKLLLASGLDPNRLPSDVPEVQSDAATVTFAELDTEPSIVPLPPSPDRVHASLEYTADVGIQCDINFSNYVAIYNTSLLRCYCKCDSRVRPMGLFVKEWAKARKINTPYHGTLSSYGYIMMVLHYLMNIAQPPVIPNLQHLARDDDAWNNRTNIELFEGFDVRFLKDEAMLERQARAGLMTKNRESLGSLLRGFFRYYTDGRGFHWVNEVISIRTQGGLLTKKSKDWTEARRAGKDNSIRLRYLFAIEDPFETDHNIARTVGHSGISAIRNELRRAWNIISKIKYAEGRWLWYKEDGGEGEDLFVKADDRGDLLKKDQEYHREKMKKCAEMARKREAERKSAENGTGARAESVDGRSSVPFPPNDSQCDANISSSRANQRRSKLIHSGRTVQTYPIGEAKNLPGKVARFGKETVNDQAKEELENTKSSLSDREDGVRKWIANTAEANNSTKADTGGGEETNSEATLDKKSSQTATEVKQKISDIVGSPVNPPLKSSQNHTVTKAQFTGSFGHAAATSGLKPSVTVDPKNPLSAWNVTIRDGRWLVWRDEKVRAGTWTGISELHRFGALDRQYPYNESRPLPDFDQQHRVANVRRKRNQYFNLRGVGSQSIDTRAPRKREVSDQERKDSAISMRQPTTVLACKTKPDQPLQSPLVRGTSNSEAPSRSAFTSAPSSNKPEVIHDLKPQSERALNGAMDFVQDPTSHDYRSDFPVPDAPNFQFDPAQLRDLEIIAKGGSGCARNAMEQQYGAYDYDGFRNVELSNEWGGGGRMGEVVTDSGELRSRDSVSAGAKTLYGPNSALGDEEGFLKELPADW